ncbi:MAG: glycosyltransferase, partial [bacterium]|nr:glycosyltransferase [bacterium]
VWQGAKIHYFPVQNVSLLYSIPLMQYLKRHCADFDILHIHGLYRFPPTYAAYVARKQGIPYIIRPHGSLDPYLYKRSTRGSVLLKRFYERIFDLPNLNAASAIHFTTEEERKRVAFLGLRAPSFVIPNGLDWSHFECLPARGGFRTELGLGNEPLVLFLGRLHPVKGLDILVPAFAQVHQYYPEAKLVLVGPDNDNYGEKVKAWVDEHRLKESTFFVDTLDGAEVLDAYVDADVFALPSYTENFGMTVVEAMACKLPVVISDQVKIYNEVVESGGGLVTHCDVDKVAKAIIELLGDSVRRKTMGSAGRSYVEAHFTWPSIVQGLMREYEVIIARNQQRGD